MGTTKKERKLPSLKGRKFYGMSKLEGDNLTYFACVKVQGEEDTSEGNIELAIALECMDVDNYAEYLIKIQLRKGDFLP